MFALVDCNNFYASCEQLFDPRLRGRPVLVLSNNDGCVVARSPEAKALGIRMAVPVFQLRELVEREEIVLRSSNYALYADMSSRVMRVLEAMAPAVEVYSIDEAFLDVAGLQQTRGLAAFGHELREAVLRWTGLRVCVGVGPSKTLAKLANYAAKKYPKTGGVVDLSCPERRDRLLRLAPVGEVWGIGGRLQLRLARHGITTAAHLAAADPRLLRRALSVTVERTARELRGVSCLGLECVAPVKQEIVSSRSFGRRITALPEMREAVAEYTARAAEKLRHEGQLAGFISVFIRTSPFSDTEPQYANQASRSLIAPSQDTGALMVIAQALLERIWRPDYRYAKAGVRLTDFRRLGQEQGDLFTNVASVWRREALMRTVDKLNARDRRSVFIARQGSRKHWSMKREQLSPAYTTRWSEIPGAS